MKETLERNGAVAKIVAPRLGTLTGADGDQVLIDFSLLTASSVLFDAVYVPGGAASIASLSAERDTIEFVTEAYRHCKPIAATGEGVELLRASPGVLGSDGDGAGAGILTANESSPALIQRFIAAIAAYRFWDRPRQNRMQGAGDETRGRATASRK
jgi:catalase